MSMLMPPDPSGAPNLPLPPGGGPPGGGPIPDTSVAPPGPLPAQGGMSALAAALGGGGPEETGEPPGLPPAEESGEPGGAQGSPIDNMSTIDLIQEAMKLLIVAFAKAQDEGHGSGIIKGMGALQQILGGDAKQQQQLATLGAGGGGPGPGG